MWFYSPRKTPLEGITWSGTSRGVSCWLWEQRRRRLRLHTVDRVVNFYDLGNDAGSKGLLWHPPKVGKGLLKELEEIIFTSDKL